jgi:hypothetical protein
LTMFLYALEWWKFLFPWIGYDLQKNSDPLPGAEWPDTEYKYIVEVRARQSFSNIVRREGVTIPEDTIHVSFVTNKRIDMKSTKKIGFYGPTASSE